MNTGYETKDGGKTWTKVNLGMACNKISLGTRYEWGLNSMFKSTDRKVSTISFTAIIQFGKKSNQ